MLFTSRLPLKHLCWTFTRNNLTSLNKSAGHQVQARRHLSKYDGYYQATKELFKCKFCEEKEVGDRFFSGSHNEKCHFFSSINSPMNS